jgi:hypothetical protein
MDAGCICDGGVMSFLAGLPRAWVSIHVPGTAVEPVLATYFAYPADRLPGLPTDVLDLAWLRHAARHPEDDMAHACQWAVLDLSPRGVADLLGSAQALPSDFARFLDGDGLRDRLRSATDSYVDLGHFAVEVDGGRLLHLVSDSQWVFHWLLYVGKDKAPLASVRDSRLGSTSMKMKATTGTRKSGATSASPAPSPSSPGDGGWTTRSSTE